MNILIDLLPWIGTALAGPAGGGVASWIASKLNLSESTVDAVKTTLQSMAGHPEQVVKLKELETEYKKAQIAAGVTLAQLEAQIVVEVNKTIQSEAAADHWPTYSWRPFVGFCFGLHIFGFVILPLFSIQPPALPSELYLATGGILGVASWFRGSMQANPNIKTDNRG